MWVWIFPQKYYRKMTGKLCNSGYLLLLMLICKIVFVVFTYYCSTAAYTVVLFKTLGKV